jgi:hypothetical protein
VNVMAYLWGRPGKTPTQNGTAFFSLRIFLPCCPLRLGGARGPGKNMREKIRCPKECWLGSGYFFLLSFWVPLPSQYSDEGSETVRLPFSWAYFLPRPARREARPEGREKAQEKTPSAARADGEKIKGVFSCLILWGFLWGPRFGRAGPPRK